MSEQQNLPGVSAFGICEQFPLDLPRSLYGSTKLASELIINEYGDAYGLRTLINRCGVLTGLWQMGKVDQGVFALWVANHYFQKFWTWDYLSQNGWEKELKFLNPYRREEMAIY